MPRSIGDHVLPDRKNSDSMFHECEILPLGNSFKFLFFKSFHELQRSLILKNYGTGYQFIPLH